MTGRARRRRCPHRRAPTPIRGSRLTAPAPRGLHRRSGTRRLAQRSGRAERSCASHRTLGSILPGVDTGMAGSSSSAPSERARWSIYSPLAADNTGAVTALTGESPRPVPHIPVAGWHAARVHRVSRQRSRRRDILQLRLDGTHAVAPLVRTPSSERNGEVSPDGQWLAYEANESGRFEIYVRPFPDVGSGPMARFDRRRHEAVVGEE